MTDIPDALEPPFDTKIAVIVREDPASWQRLNVTAFLSAGIAAANPQLIGAPYQDDGTYLPLHGPKNPVDRTVKGARLHP